MRHVPSGEVTVSKITRFCQGCNQEREDTTFSDHFRTRLCVDCYNKRSEAEAAIDRESDAYKLGVAEMDARKWHETCETLMTMAGLSSSGSPQEMLTEFQSWLTRRRHIPAQKFQAPDTGHPQGQSLGPEPAPSAAAAPQFPEPTKEPWEPWPNSYNPNNTTQLG